MTYRLSPELDRMRDRVSASWGEWGLRIKVGAVEESFERAVERGWLIEVEELDE